MVLDVIRYLVFFAFAYSALAALGSWAVRTRRISPFSRTAHLIRRSTDPILRPFEDWIYQRGGNPQNAEWWLLGGTVVGGIVTVSFAGWLARNLGGAIAVAQTGDPSAVIRLLVYYVVQVLTLALIARVIGSWFGVGRHNRFMRLAYRLTDWIVEPLSRVIPPINIGGQAQIDVSPLVAFFILRIFLMLIT